MIQENNIFMTIQKGHYQPYKGNLYEVIDIKLVIIKYVSLV